MFVCIERVEGARQVEAQLDAVRRRLHRRHAAARRLQRRPRSTAHEHSINPTVTKDGRCEGDIVRLEAKHLWPRSPMRDAHTAAEEDLRLPQLGQAAAHGVCAARLVPQQILAATRVPQLAAKVDLTR